MSNRNNDVFRVLPVTECALLEKDKSVEDLLPGQLGVFNAETNVSIDATTDPMPKEVFFSLAYTTPSGSVDYRTSAGQLIQRAGVVSLTEKNYNAGSPMKVTISNAVADCDTEYGIRVEFRNARISRIQGYNQFSKAYMVKTSCCDDCTSGCGTVDANVLAKLFVAEINKDQAGLLLAQFTDKETGAVLTEAEVDAIIAANEAATDPADKVYVDFQLVSRPLAIGAFCQVNLHYYKLLETTLIVSLIEGFGCSGATTVSEYPVFAEGTGINVQQKEYHGSGWAGSGPYKVSEVTGTAKGDIVYLAEKAKNYHQLILQHNQTSESGWQEYMNPMSTIFAIPTTCSSLKATLKGVVEAFIAGKPSA